LAHCPLRERADRQAGVDPDVRGHDRAVADEQVAIAENAVVAIDDAARGVTSDHRTSEDVRRGWNVRDRLEDHALRNAAGAELNRLSYSVAGQANVSRSLERNAELQIQLDKSVYLGGDTVEISIRAPYTGAGLITIEREYGCGAAAIASQLADHLGWKLWDHLIAEEIARLANVECAAVMRCEERMDSRLHRLAKSFWRGSYERNSAALGSQVFDTDRMMSMMQEIMDKIAREGNAVVVGRGAPYLLREHPDAFHVFLYAPRAEKIRRTMAEGHSRPEADDLVDSSGADHGE